MARPRVAAAKILGIDYIGTGGGQAAGTNLDSLASILQSAEILNRLGKESVEDGVGPVYIHNHTGEFDRQVRRQRRAEDRLADHDRAHRRPLRRLRRSTRFWSSDAFNDVTGAATAAFINKYPTRVKLMHVKDGINVTTQPSPTNSRGGSPRAFGTGEVDYRPIFAAGKGKVQYYSQEHDGGTLTDAGRQLHATSRAAARAPSRPCSACRPRSRAVAAGTAAAANVLPITITNTGDAPLTITNIALASNNTDGLAAAGPRGRARRR